MAANLSGEGCDNCSMASIPRPLSPPSFACTLVRVRLPTPILLASRIRSQSPIPLLRTPCQVGILIPSRAESGECAHGSISMNSRPLDYVANRASQLPSAPYHGSNFSHIQEIRVHAPKLNRRIVILFPEPRSSRSHRVLHIPCNRFQRTAIHRRLHSSYCCVETPKSSRRPVRCDDDSIEFDVPLVSFIHGTIRRILVSPL